MNLFEPDAPKIMPRPTGPGLKVWSKPRQHYRHYIEPGTKIKNELVDRGVWWVAQYDDGTECSGACPLQAAAEALGWAKERVK
jgi:hypothetical protein